MNDHVTLALMLTAGTVGALHSLAPDHWVPFAALARARNWTPLRTARLAFLCAVGHVTVSALLGVLAVIVGRRAVEALGTTLAGAAPLILIGFGLAYMLWALHHLIAHGGHHHHRRGATEWGLFLLFCADPCVALIPMIVAASAKGWGAVGGVIAVYELATIAAIVILVVTAHAGARRLRFAWFDRYGDLVAGAAIVTVGTLVTVIGI
ncbi:MAG TPA: hypothetical protein VEO54_02990 [Thermoanaerobaculia bacterium]|nr:hypothetical protein [Thermoanaerobaculia bacterium]